MSPTHARGYPVLQLPAISQRYRWRRIHVLVAELFLGDRPDGMQIDHIDGDKSNNCLENLEYVTPKENTIRASNLGLMPRSKRWKKIGCKSKFIGVTKSRNKWRARVKCNGVWHQCGSYESEIDAAAAYNATALKLFGESAILNILPDVLLQAAKRANRTG